MAVSPSVRINVTGARGESQADILRRTGQFGILPTDDDATAIGKLNADAAASASLAESAAGPTYADTSAGLAATTDGEAFAVDNGDGTVTIYLNDGGSAVEQRTLFTTAFAASSAAAAAIGTTGPSNVQADIDAFQDYIDGGSASVAFLPADLTEADRTAKQKFDERLTLDDFGAIGDNALHTAAEWIIPGAYGRYANLAAVQVDYPDVAATTDDLNSAAIRKALSYAHSSGSGVIRLGIGEYAYDETIALTTRGVAIEGVKGFRQFGQDEAASMLVWKGGAFPMMTANATGYTFSWFGVRNEGLATDWLEINSGGQTFVWDNVFCQPGGAHVSFSRSFVRSNGNRLGYSLAWACRIGSVAPILFDLDGQGTGNSVTPIEFGGRCIFASSTQPVTVLNIKGETIEQVIMKGNTFIQDGYELTIIDTTDSPITATINCLNFSDNEIDSDITGGADDAAYRFFKLTNVESVLFNNNKMNLGGTKNYAAALVNSHVTECVGNYYQSVGTALFECDATSTVRSAMQGFSQRPLFTTITAGITRPTYGASISIDGRRLSTGQHEIIEVGVTDNAGYTITIDASSPEWTGIGQVFTLVIKNISGGAISNGTLGGNFKASAAMTAPANGFNRSYSFYWNGTAAIEMSRMGADVAN